MTIVVDASMVVAGLIANGAVGRWAEALVASESLAAPHIMQVEAANILRRSALAGDITTDTASLAHGDLARLPVELFPYAALSGRVWELRENVTAYDACYVALAEMLEADLATLDLKLSRAPEPQCAFALPPAGSD